MKDQAEASGGVEVSKIIPEAEQVVRQLIAWNDCPDLLERDSAEAVRIITAAMRRRDERLGLYEALFEIREACCSGMGSLPTEDVERGQLALERWREE